VKEMATQTNKQGGKCERCTKEREREANKESYGSLLIIQHIDGDGDTNRHRQREGEREIEREAKKAMVD
jgi:hypothetical protein